jgi:phosphatidylethanolamine N-methyltransferase
VRALFCWHAFMLTNFCPVDIERFYGQRKPLAERVPFRRSTASEQPTPTGASTPLEHVPRVPSNATLADALSTPSATEGETASDTETTEGERDADVTDAERDAEAETRMRTPALPLSRRRSADGLSSHDLLVRYFRRDTILLWNFDIFR